jgi:hypothetical protein
MKLLSPQFTNPKMARSGGPYLSAILHLAPSILSGRNTCPDSSEGCRKACLNTAGRGKFSNVQAARIRKTNEFFKDRAVFFSQLEKDIGALVRKAAREKLKPVVRLNGTSDIPWEMGKLFSRWPNVQFYDYTPSLKRLKRLKRFHAADKALNYHLTFSRKEDNDSECRQALKLGFNVAVVFKYKPFPKTFLWYPVIDGDMTDYRFNDAPGSIVGLLAKGLAKRDTSGFVVDNNPLVAKLPFRKVIINEINVKDLDK